ncbi:MAG: hypothetical protein GY941_30510 [Planctomycetes bacterium]|nr:hypothetical protein [Planctomycetota bacterium]
MQRYEIEQVEQARLVEYTCDVCGRDLTDILEGQEAYTFERDGGYGSVFGDGSRINLDVCQHCFKDAFEEYLQ